MWATSVPILVLLGLCSRLRPDVRDDRRQTAYHRLMPPGRGHKNTNDDDNKSTRKVQFSAKLANFQALESLFMELGETQKSHNWPYRPMIIIPMKNSCVRIVIRISTSPKKIQDFVNNF